MPDRFCAGQNGREGGPGPASQDAAGVLGESLSYGGFVSVGGPQRPPNPLRRRSDGLSPDVLDVEAESVVQSSHLRKRGITEVIPAPSQHGRSIPAPCSGTALVLLSTLSASAPARPLGRKRRRARGRGPHGALHDFPAAIPRAGQQIPVDVDRGLNGAMPQPARDLGNRHTAGQGRGGEEVPQATRRVLGLAVKIDQGGRHPWRPIRPDFEGQSAGHCVEPSARSPDVAKNATTGLRRSALSVTALREPPASHF